MLTENTSSLPVQLIPRITLHCPPIPVRSSDEDLQCWIAEEGLHDPLRVRPLGDQGYVVIQGRRRFVLISSLVYQRRLVQDWLTDAVLPAATAYALMPCLVLPPEDEWVLGGL